jgi:hypothetical protein
MRRHGRLQEQLYNGRPWLALHDLPFSNDALAVLQLSTNVGIPIRHRQHLLPEPGSLAHRLYRSVQAAVLLGQGSQNKIPHTEATQLPFGKAMAQELPPHRLRVQKCTQTLACISHLWQMQLATQLTAVSAVVGHANNGRHLAGVLT